MKGRGHERKGGRHDETDRDGSRGDIELAANDPVCAAAVATPARGAVGRSAGRSWRGGDDPPGVEWARIFVRPGATDMRKQTG